MNYAYDNLKTRALACLPTIHRLYRKKTAKEELRRKEEKNEEVWGRKKQSRTRMRWERKQDKNGRRNRERGWKREREREEPRMGRKEGKPIASGVLLKWGSDCPRDAFIK